MRNLEQFFARELLRAGVRRAATVCRVREVLQSIERGEGEVGDIEMLEQTTVVQAPAKPFRAHAPGAMEPLQSALKFFRGAVSSRASTMCKHQPHKNSR